MLGDDLELGGSVQSGPISGADPVSLTVHLAPLTVHRVKGRYWDAG